MKHRLAIAILLVLALSGCSAETESKKVEDKTIVNEEEATSKDDTSGPVESDADTAWGNDDSQTIEEYLSRATAIQSGEETQAGEIAKFRFDESYWCKDILPENTEGSYNYIGQSEGYWHLVLKGVMENKQEKMIDLSTVQVGDITPYIALIKYGEEYYLAKLAAATEENDNITTQIDAKKETTVYLFANIPEEKKEKGLAASVLIGFSDLQENICNNVAGSKIYWDKCQYLYTMEFEVKEEK